MTRVQKRLSAVINFARIVLEIDLENVEDGNNQRRVSSYAVTRSGLPPGMYRGTARGGNPG
jgi:hypothetical protein